MIRFSASGLRRQFHPKCVSLFSIMFLFLLCPVFAFGQQVNFRVPQRSYVAAGAKIRVESQLAQQNPALAQRAVRRLQEKIAVAISILPPAARPLLSKVPFYIMQGSSAVGGGKDTGLEYFQRDAPEHRSHLDPNWRSCIVVYSAANYAGISDFWALKAVVHEFAHAWQLEQGPENQPSLVNAFQSAMQKRLYHDVVDDAGLMQSKTYAATNHLEYFAELTCMYFVGCNYHPFNKARLAVYDPPGYSMVEFMWNGGASRSRLGQPQPSPPSVVGNGARGIGSAPPAQSTRPNQANGTFPAGAPKSNGQRGIARTSPAQKKLSPARQWSDSQGRVFLTAQFKAYNKGIVTVVANDSEKAFAFNVLSSADQRHVLQQTGILR